MKLIVSPLLLLLLLQTALAVIPSTMTCKSNMTGSGLNFTLYVDLTKVGLDEALFNKRRDADPTSFEGLDSKQAAQGIGIKDETGAVTIFYINNDKESFFNTEGAELELTFATTAEGTQNKNSVTGSLNHSSKGVYFLLNNRQVDGVTNIDILDCTIDQ